MNDRDELLRIRASIRASKRAVKALGEQSRNTAKSLAIVEDNLDTLLGELERRLESTAPKEETQHGNGIGFSSDALRERLEAQHGRGVAGALAP